MSFKIHIFFYLILLYFFLTYSNKCLQNLINVEHIYSISISEFQLICLKVIKKSIIL